MSLTIFPNTVLFNEPRMDMLRAELMDSVQRNLPAEFEMVRYILALEHALLDCKAQYKRDFSRETWADVHAEPDHD